ncbi:MAG TPA: magnesium transporter CorA family protein, partial [Propionicimonas sp.]|nr:magnesium transporter CorA family protein [Propionicimonas sp.]
SRVWREGAEVTSDFPLESLDGWLAEPGATVWLDLLLAGPEDTGDGVLDQLAEELALDPLAVEDVREPHERPKATWHPNHLFFTSYALSTDAGPDGIRLGQWQVSGFVLANALVTIRTADHGEFEEVLSRAAADGHLAEGVGGLVHALLDTLVDDHFAAIQSLDDELEKLEDLLFDSSGGSREVLQGVFALRKALVRLRRVVLPMREVVGSLMRYRSERRHESLASLGGQFDDLYDHVIRAAEWTESLRDLVGSIVETNLSLQDARLNEVMKKLAGWAAIISVPTAVTGWFGQNLPYPGFEAVSGLVQSAVLILVGTVGLYLLFRRIDWI